MKKLLFIALTVLVFVALAAGCSKKEEPAPPAITTIETTVSTQQQPQPLAETTVSIHLQEQPEEQPPAETAALPSTTPSESFPASGTTKSSTATESQEVLGDKIVLKETGSHDYHGTLEGKLLIKFTVEVSMVDGTFTLTGDGTFTGSVNGREGTLTTRHNATGQALPDGSGTIRDEVSIVSGTGGLSDLHGTLVVEGTVGEVAEGIYSGTLSFGAEPPPPETAVTTTLDGANASGTLNITNQINNSPWAIKSGIMSANLTTFYEYHGDLEGMMEDTGIIKADMAAGKVTGNTVGIFTGMVKGKQGNLTVAGNWTNQMLSSTEKSGECTYTILSGTGELEGLEGTITVKMITKNGVSERTYEGALSFK